MRCWQDSKVAFENNSIFARKLQSYSGIKIFQYSPSHVDVHMQTLKPLNCSKNGDAGRNRTGE